MTEMVCVSREGRITPGCAGLYKPEHEAALTRLVEFVHGRTPAKIGIQLGHSGRKGSTKLMWEGMDEPLESGNWDLIAPSPLPYLPVSQVPREMSRADMDFAMTWPVQFQRGSRKPPSGRTDGPRPRLELIRGGATRGRHQRWRPQSAR